MQGVDQWLQQLVNRVDVKGRKVERARGAVGDYT